MKRALLRLLCPRETRVLEAMSEISTDTLRHWISRGFLTVEKLAMAELDRRGLPYTATIERS